MTQIAAQLFTIRDFTKTREDFAASMAKIREIGYRAVQVSQIGAVSDADVKLICDDNGLIICNSHASVELLLSDPDAVIAQHELWGARHVAIGGMPLEYRGSEDGFKRFVDHRKAVVERSLALLQETGHPRLEFQPPPVPLLHGFRAQGFQSVGFLLG